MTANRRIALNIVVTYGRSLFALAVGLLCGRWTFLALGKVDYGLLGVVGGMVSFLAFLNSLMAGAISRFYAYSVGAAQKQGNDVAGMEECRRWFSIAVFTHTFLPTLLAVIGEPIGEWAICNYLVVPDNRVAACVCAWRFTVFSCFVGMVNVPFSAMYTAKQEIAERTLYDFLTTFFHAFVGYYMITHPGLWLAKYVAWSCIIAVVPKVIICIRAIVKYPECRFCFAYVWDAERFKKLINYAGSRFCMSLSRLLASNGMSVMVNKCLGPIRNSAVTVGNNVAGHCLTLSYSFAEAFSPAITNAAGAGDMIRLRKLAFATCSLSGVAVGVFAIPMILEVDEVMKLWLKTPPEWAGALCICTLVYSMLNGVVEGHWMSVLAIGKVVAYNIAESLCWFLALPIAYVFFLGGLDVVGVGLAWIGVVFLSCLVKIYFGRKIAGLSIRYWFGHVFVPFLIVFAASLVAGLAPRLLLDPSLFRIIVTGIAVEFALLPLSWRFVFQEPERAYCKEKFFRIVDKFRAKA